MRASGVAAVLLVCGGCSLFGHTATPADPRALVDALRSGGYVLYLRHAATEGHDDKTVVVEDCATQARLSEAGRAQAEAIGTAFHRLLIPVAEVRSSPYCRCADTARLAFDRVLLDTDLGPIAGADEALHARRLAAAARLLSTTPPPGTNTVLVSHSDNWTALGEPPLEVGELAIVKPLPGSYQLIARVSAAAWPEIPDLGVR